MFGAIDGVIHIEADTVGEGKSYLDLSVSEHIAHDAPFCNISSA